MKTERPSDEATAKVVVKDIPGYEGLYKATTHGEIVITERRIWNGKVMALCKSKTMNTRIGNHGYKNVDLRKGGERKTRLVHRLIAETFISGKSLTRIQVNHIDGDKLNNAVSNLEWCSPKENVKHAMDIGLVNETTRASKLTPSSVHEIRELYSDGVSQAMLGIIFHVSHRTIHDIVKGKTWTTI